MNIPLTRPERGEAMDAFLKRIGRPAATRTVLAGDASFRRYERVYDKDVVLVLMDAPSPWEDVGRFAQVTEMLAQCGVTVPSIVARDDAEGFLLLEDLGDASFTRLLTKVPEREAELYLAATDALVRIYEASLSAPEFGPRLAPYDMATYLREVALFSDWFLPQVMGLEAAQRVRAEYLALWEQVIGSAKLKQNCLVHRDYHADNLFWLEGREGFKAVGMIDYQDALWGDAAYDLASLLEDARRDVSDTVVADCFARFVTAIDEPAQAFAARYAVIAAQRNAKIIGIFSRLCLRDGKAQYLDYLPRVWGHFLNDLHHPQLLPIRQFVDAHVPAAWRGRYTPDYTIGAIEA